ncbi:MAG: GNAT family N-acetyltransferase [Usitatibacter sp.]
MRAATPADSLCLGVLGTQVFLDTYATSGIRRPIAAEVVAAFSTSAVRALFDDPALRITVAERDDHLIGFVQTALATGHDLVRSPSPVELRRIYVQEPFTRQGVGALLLRHAEEAADSEGATHLWLSAWVHNERALRFYARHGYIDLGSTPVQIEGESYVNRVLAKRLGR